ncbi:MAG: L,D-transpeptidase [Bdellovibrionales bacterium]|nr:L,D-transpeptidase [Bdellovibrionales bacterium]
MSNERPIDATWSDHGTNKSRYKHLGKQASHGCIRTKQGVANKHYEHILSEDMYDPLLLDFNQAQRLPRAPLKDPRAGYKALFIFFYGYDGNKGLNL